MSFHTHLIGFRSGELAGVLSYLICKKFKLKTGFRWRRAKIAPELTAQKKQKRVEWCVRNQNNNFLFYMFV
jgi:hypothetical protein